MIFNFGAEKRGQAQKLWEGTQPLTGQSIVDFFNPRENGSGPVSANTALGLAPVYRATQVLAGAIASADKNLVGDDGGLKRSGQEDHIASNPNPMIDPYAFWEYVMTSLLFHGNFYGILVREGNGVGPVRNITPLDPNSVTPKVVVSNSGREIKEIIYEVRFKDGDQPVGIPADEMLHIKGLSGNWLEGSSVLAHGARVFNNSIMTDQYAESFYGNGSLLSGVLRTDKRLDEKSAGALKSRWRQKIQGIGNAFDIVVLDSGTEFQPITVSPQDAQFIEARRFNVEEMGRMFGIPKEILGEAGQTSPVDPEKVAIVLVQFTLRFWGKRIESAFNRQVLPDGDNLQIILHDLILADERTRSSAAVMWRKSQVMSINELRQERGLPPVASPDADDPLFTPELTASDPGTNLGNQEQPVPSEQEPADEALGDNN